jgi:ABC-type sugar transport system permease subunit
MTGQPYTFANILSEMPRWAHRLFWTAVFAVAAVVLSIFLLLL